MYLWLKSEDVVFILLPHSTCISNTSSEVRSPAACEIQEECLGILCCVTENTRSTTSRMLTDLTPWHYFCAAVRETEAGGCEIGASYLSVCLPKWLDLIHLQRKMTCTEIPWEYNRHLWLNGTDSDTKMTTSYKTEICFIWNNWQQQNYLSPDEVGGNWTERSRGRDFYYQKKLR